MEPARPESLDTGGIWSIARGVARQAERYKDLLIACDAERRNDLHGRGQLQRSDVAGLLGTGARQARHVTSVLIEREVLVADSPRAPLRLAFPAALASRWMPGLFPERAS